MGRRCIHGGIAPRACDDPAGLSWAGQVILELPGRETSHLGEGLPAARHGQPAAACHEVTGGHATRAKHWPSHHASRHTVGSGDLACVVGVVINLAPLKVVQRECQWGSDEVKDHWAQLQECGDQRAALLNPALCVYHVTVLLSAASPKTFADSIDSVCGSGSSVP